MAGLQDRLRESEMVPVFSGLDPDDPILQESVGREEFYSWSGGPDGAPTALIYRDSFGIAVLPFLHNTFSRVDVIRSYLIKPEQIEKIKPDVLLGIWAERYLAEPIFLETEIVRMSKKVKGETLAIVFLNTTGANEEDEHSDYGIVRTADPHRHDPGMLMFGVYEAVPTGSYEAVFGVRTEGLSNEPVLKLDVVSDGGTVVLAEKLIETDSDHDGYLKYRLIFSVDTAEGKEIECRAEYLGGAVVAVESVKVEKMGDL